MSMKSWTKHLQPSAGTGGYKLLQGGTMNWCLHPARRCPSLPSSWRQLVARQAG